MNAIVLLSLIGWPVAFVTGWMLAVKLEKPFADRTPEARCYMRRDTRGNSK